MRLVSAFAGLFCAVLLVGLPVAAQSQEISRTPRELGTAVLRELAIENGKMHFRVDSNGCTDSRSFEVRISREAGITATTPHYRLTIQRTRVDECKAMLWDGVVIELDLEKDLGLSGAYTLTVTNPVLGKGGSTP